MTSDQGSGHVRILVCFDDAGLGPRLTSDVTERDIGHRARPAHDEVVVPSGPSVSHREDGKG